MLGIVLASIVHCVTPEYVTLCHLSDDHPSTISVESTRVAAHLAHGDYLGECRSDCDDDDDDGEHRWWWDHNDDDHHCETTTTTTTVIAPTTTILETTTTLAPTTTTTLPDLGCEDVPIGKDPAFLDWRSGKFSIHGSIIPEGDLNATVVSGIAVTLQTVEDGIFLGAGCALEQKDPKHWRCKNDVIHATVKLRPNDFTFRIKGKPPFNDPTSNMITTRVSFTCNGGENTAEWSGNIGTRIWVKY